MTKTALPPSTSPVLCVPASTKRQTESPSEAVCVCVGSAYHSVLPPAAGLLDALKSNCGAFRAEGNVVIPKRLGLLELVVWMVFRGAIVGEAIASTPATDAADGTAAHAPDVGGRIAPTPAVPASAPDTPGAPPAAASRSCCSSSASPSACSDGSGGNRMRSRGRSTRATAASPGERGRASSRPTPAGTAGRYGRAPSGSPTCRRSGS